MCAESARTKNAARERRIFDGKKEQSMVCEKVVETLYFPCVDNGGKGDCVTVISNAVFVVFMQTARDR